MGLLNADADKVTVSEVCDELRTLPFLADRRVVLIKRADKFISDNRELLERYFDNPCATGRLVMTVENWDARTRLAKKLPSVGKLITVTEPKRGELAGRLIDYAKDKYAKKLGRGEAELLAEISGDDLAGLYAQIDKLALYAEGSNSITAAHIEALAGHNRLFNAFAVIDAVMTGNTSQAVERLAKMLTSDKSAEYTAIGAFAYQWRRLFRAAAMLERGQNRRVIERNMNLWGNTDAFFACLGKTTTRQIGDNLRLLAETDYRIKTGRATPRTALEQLVFKLADERAIR
jgi:DNA polymerase-3 subunit delta